ncbi:MAG TPA: hypothetical protein VNL70_00110, partial [Tepidisphaeraceae bacterium]|nr:hypothetical protein [Tepidisphaeraceae bacterium]
ADHLNAGGSAMVLTMPNTDNLSEALKPFGLELDTGAVIVHEVPKGERAQSSDIAENAARLPFIFVINEYGPHLLTKPVQSLDSVIVGSVPVKLSKAEGVTQTPLLPIPDSFGKVWAETNIDSITDENLKFDEGVDTPGPMLAAAAAEKGSSRLVVMGSVQSFTDQILNIPDQEMLRRRIVVSRFPGNGELFTNAVFWLAKMEPMIAISPAAMEVSRIERMSEAALAAWRVGVLLILLPGLVLAAGIGMYFARRD